jgi:endonuclease/exonuclease/phosphatase family metal-dependent hydrolase
VFLLVCAVFLAAGALVPPPPPASGAAPDVLDRPEIARRTETSNGRYVNGVDVRVMSFNIHSGLDDEDDLDLESVEDDIRTARADIVGLQEVDMHWSGRSGFVDQARWLARELGMHYAFGAARSKAPKPHKGRKKPGHYGIAVLSKYPILSVRTHRLRTIEYKEDPTQPRVLMELVIDVKGTQISFYNTHFDNKRSEQRQSEARDVLAMTAASSRPSILVGDFNAEADAPEMQIITQQFADTFAQLGAGGENTFPFEDPSRRIDYILVRGTVAARWGKAIETDSSDHLPVIAGLSVVKPVPVRQPGMALTRPPGAPGLF